MFVAVVSAAMAGCIKDDFNPKDAADKTVQVMKNYTKSELRISGLTYSALLSHPQAVETEVETVLADAAVGEVVSCILSDEETTVKEREEGQNLYRLVRSRVDVRLQGVPYEIPVYFLQEKAYLRTENRSYDFLTPRQQITAKFEAMELPYVVIGGRVYLRSKLQVQVRISPEGMIEPVVSTTDLIVEVPTNVRIEKPEEIVDIITFSF